MEPIAITYSVFRNLDTLYVDLFYTLVVNIRD
jgi:hypothetical protein